MNILFWIMMEQLYTVLISCEIYYLISCRLNLQIHMEENSLHPYVSRISSFHKIWGEKKGSGLGLV